MTQAEKHRFIRVSQVKSWLKESGLRCSDDFLARLHGAVLEQLQGAKLGIRHTGKKTVMPEHAEKGVPILRMDHGRRW